MSKEVDNIQVKDKRWVTLGLVSLGLVSLGVTENVSADETNGEWIARSVSEIKKDLQQEENYQIKWGDTLWSLSQATNVSIARLAEINNIDNISLINSGVSLSITGNQTESVDNRKIVVKDKKGKVQIVANASTNEPIIDEEETNHRQNIDKLSDNLNGTKTITDRNIIKTGKNQSTKVEEAKKVAESEGNIEDLGKNQNIKTLPKYQQDKKDDVKEVYSIYVKYIDDYNNILEEEKYQSENKNILEIEKKSFDKYTYVSGAEKVEFNKKNNNKIYYVRYNKESVKYDFKVNYVFDDGRKTETVNYSVESGKDYEIQAKDFSGYEVDGNKYQKVTANENKEITFKYNKIVEKEVNLEIIYEFDDKETEKVNQKIKQGKVYTINAKDFEGYELEGARSNTLKIEKDTQLIYKYKKKKEDTVKLKINYVFDDGSPSKVEDEKLVKGQEYKILGKEFIGYTLDGKDSFSITAEKDQEITFNYKKSQRKKYNLTVKYNFPDKASVVENSIVEEGTAYKLTAKEYEGYSIDGEDSKTFLATKDEVVEFNYKKEENEKFNLKVTYIFSGGKKPITENHLVEKGKTIEVKSEVFEGYQISGENMITYVVEGDKDVNFFYDEKQDEEYSFIVNYVDGDGNILKSKTFKGKEGEEKDLRLAIQGYHKVNGSDFIKMTKDLDKKTLEIDYEADKKNLALLTVVNNFSDKDSERTEKELTLGRKITVNAEHKEGYTLIGDSTKEVVLDRDKQVDFNYKKDYEVTLKYIGNDGKELGTKILKGYDGQRKVVPLKEYQGYNPTNKRQEIIFTDKINGTVIPVNYEKETIKHSVTVISKLDNGAIYNKEKFDVINGTEFRYTPKKIDGYNVDKSEYTKVITEDETIEFNYTKISGKVHTIKINYIFEDKPSEIETFNVKEGEIFEVKPRNFEGYVVEKSDKETKFTVTKDDTVNITYLRKNVKITTKLNLEGAEDKETSQTFKYGDDVKITAPRIDGYELEGTATREFKATKDEIVEYKYKKISKYYTITVRDKFNDGKADEVSYLNIKQGDKLDVKGKNYTGYDIQGNNTQQVVGDSSKEIIFNYAKHVEKATLTTRYKFDDKEDVVERQELAKGTYTISAKNFDNYVLTTEKDLNIVLDKDKEAVFEYKKNVVTPKPENQVDTITLNAWCDNQLVKTETKTVKKGEKFVPETEALGLNPTEYDLSNTTSYDEITGVGGKTYTYDFTVRKLTNYLPQSEYQIAKDTILREVNNYRASFGLEPVVYDEYLNRGADTRAVEIETRFDHVRPDGSGVEEAVMEQGKFPGIFGENIAINSRGYNNGEQAGLALFQQWKDSPDHRALMLTRQMKYLGVGIHSNGRNLYGVQLFSVELYDL